MAEVEREVAEALLSIDAVGFKPEDPIVFKSGIISPVYVDNRRLPFYPNQWTTVIQGFVNLIRDEEIELDVIAGIETAGIPHSAALGYVMGIPSVFVRKAQKEYGKKKMIEGGDVSDQRVLLVEDHVTTSGSVMHGVRSLRNETATVDDCLAITTYGFKEAVKAFDEEAVNLHTLTNFLVILEIAEGMNKLTLRETEIVQDWLREPYGWKARQENADS